MVKPQLLILFIVVLLLAPPSFAQFGGGGSSGSSGGFGGGIGGGGFEGGGNDLGDFSSHDFQQNWDDDTDVSTPLEDAFGLSNSAAWGIENREDRKYLRKSLADEVQKLVDELITDHDERQYLDEFTKSIGNDHYCGASSMCGDSTVAGPINIDVLSNKNSDVLSGGAEIDAILYYSFPYVVALRSNKRVTCSGALIGPKTIITAAHCVCDGMPDDVFIGTSMYDGPSNQGISFALKLSGEYDLPYGDTCTNGGHSGPSDIALIYLRRPAAIYNSVQIPEILGVVDGVSKSALAVGFGASEKNEAGGVKRFAAIPLSVCTDDDASTVGCRPDIEFFSIPEGSSPTDTCLGDSGGPILELRSKRIVILGVTSRKQAGGRNEYCGSGGIYAATALPETANIRDWLRRHMR